MSGDVTWRVALDCRDHDEIVTAADVYRDKPSGDGLAWIVLRDSANVVVFKAPEHRVVYVRRQQYRPVAAELPKMTRAELKVLIREAVAAELEEEDRP